MKKSLSIIVFTTITLLAQSLFAQDIFEAVRNGDLAKVKELVEKDPELVKARNIRQSTPLHVAADVGHASIAEYLIIKGANLNAVNAMDVTPLFYAKKLEIVQLLAEKGADINHGFPYSNALRYSLINGRRDMAEYLLEKGVRLPEIDNPISIDLLINALKCGSAKFLETYERKGFDPLYESETKTNLLHYASESNSTELIDHLVRQGVPVNKKNLFGFVPLHVAALKGNTKIVEYFIQKGADIDLRTHEGKTAYQLALEAKKDETTEYLRSAGADQSSQNLPVLTGEYMGQTKPGKKAVPFAPASVNFQNPFHSPMVFSPSGDEVYWCVIEGIYSSRQIDGRWTMPEKYSDGDVPFISPDGKKLFFIAQKEIQGESKEIICVREKTKQDWSEPDALPDVINSIPGIHWQISVDRKGNLYFGARQPATRDTKIYCSEFIDGVYQKPQVPENLKDINAFSPYVAPDASYLIISKAEEISSHLVIFFRKKDGTWTKGIRVTDYIGGKDGICPTVTRDGRYLFFIGSADAKAIPFWVDASFIKDLRKKALKEDK